MILWRFGLNWKMDKAIHLAVEEKFRSIESSEGDGVIDSSECVIKVTHIQQAVSLVSPSVSKQQIKHYEELRDKLQRSGWRNNIEQITHGIIFCPFRNKNISIPFFPGDRYYFFFKYVDRFSKFRHVMVGSRMVKFCFQQVFSSDPYNCRRIQRRYYTRYCMIILRISFLTCVSFQIEDKLIKKLH